VIGFLRFVGVTNAAVWLGASVFFTFAAGPAFFSEAMKSLLGPNNYPAYSGAIAQLVIERYFLLQHICGAVALAHLAAGWLYAGRALPRLTTWLLVALVAINLAGGFIVQPKLRRLHEQMYPDKYGLAPVPAKVEEARKSFRAWHGVSQAANLAVLLGLLFYHWQIVGQGAATRVSGGKFGG
jgi:hypothetical protein